MHAYIDHLVYATPALERGMDEIERLTGIAPSMGGQHPGRGTRNALLSLGPDVYLEIIAPDPDQPAPSGARWLGVDAAPSSRLATWAAKASDLASLRDRAIAAGVPVGAVKAGMRDRADGVRLSWSLTDPAPLIAGGVIPFFIDWGDSPHPAHASAQGAALVDFHVEHPEAARVERMLRALDLGVRVVGGPSAAVVAVIEGRHGRFVLR